MLVANMRNWWQRLYHNWLFIRTNQNWKSCDD